jgi:hypothetical protein
VALAWKALEAFLHAFAGVSGRPPFRAGTGNPATPGVTRFD